MVRVYHPTPEDTHSAMSLGSEAILGVNRKGTCHFIALRWRVCTKSRSLEEACMM